MINDFQENLFDSKNDKKIRLAILSQDDAFVIPKNIMKLNDIICVKIVSVITLNTKGALTNKKMMFFKGFGMIQSIKMGWVVGLGKLLEKTDQIFSYKLFNKPRSLGSAAYRCMATHKTINNPNHITFMRELKKDDIDLVVSFSAPCVFGNELLNTPKYGCINLHSSLLPKYAGLLPSFWTLYKREKKIGATVHYMDNKIDNGQILGQIEVKTPKNPSMFKVIKLTKELGGNLMCDVIRSIYYKTLTPKKNNIKDGSYYSWPSIEQIRDFRKNGGQLI
jgi:methionyl-tRNA formyltransferase